MTYQYSHTYRRGPELSEAEIYQAGSAKEERLAELKKATVNFYLDDNTGEVVTVCAECFRANERACKDLSYIDKAGDWDICAICDAQNVPVHYHGEI